MLTVIKIGGAILEQEKARQQFLVEFAKISGKKVLVHGGGRTSSRWMKALGQEPTMIDGRRVTDATTLEIVSLAYAGLNKQLVAQLYGIGQKAVGLCGADENVLLAQKRSPSPIDFGWVGDIDRNGVNAKVLLGYMKHDIVPVLAPLTHDGQGHLLNTNADTIASVVAQALQQYEPVRLIYAFEKPGLLGDSEDESTLLTTFSKDEFTAAVEARSVHQGMLPKLHNAFDALEHGVEEVYLCRTDEVHRLDTKTHITL
ncbi:MAG: acetylglutamate kinase [Saprospiraceae bacterium]|nr:acetylglutamate kinase [Saprospiraceae bacterium]